MTINADLAIQRYGKQYGEYSAFFRSIAIEVDQDPERIFNYLDHTALQQLHTMQTLDAAEFFLLYEALSYGDIGVLFAAPRTCLSGILLQFIGSNAMREEYFDILRQQRIRSFFAATEPQVGSDLSNLETHFDLTHAEDTFAISGQKILVGNLGIAKIGVIIGRVRKGPLGIAAALIKPGDFIQNPAAVTRETLPMFGVKAALLGKADFQKFIVPKAQLLGQHLSAMERGLQAVIKTFNIMRLGISGLALGHAQAALDYITIHRATLTTQEQIEIEHWQAEIQALRQLALAAANHNQINRADTARIALVKVRASQLAERISTASVRYFGAAVMIEHPFVVKSLRDCFGYEYMDGTSNIQRKNLYQGHVGGRLEFHFA